MKNWVRAALIITGILLLNPLAVGQISIPSQRNIFLDSSSSFIPTITDKCPELLEHAMEQCDWVWRTCPYAVADPKGCIQGGIGASPDRCFRYLSRCSLDLKVLYDYCNAKLKEGDS